MDKQISKLKTFSYLLALVVVIQIAGTVLFFRNSNLISSASIKNINSLIRELGQVKDENRILSQKLDTQNKINELNESTLNNIFQEFNSKIKDQGTVQTEISTYQTQLEKDKQDLYQQNLSINNLLNNQNQEIEKLKDALAIKEQGDQLNEQITAILFLGSNQKLTDSIILALINPVTKKTTLVSIPRDLYINGRKINEYMQNFGADTTKDVIREITGIKVDKYVEFDFEAFTDIVDYLGGINVEVDKKLVDERYPTSDYGYKTVTFTPGIEKMNGERALEYARSRKSTNDFDRNLRQQKIILSLKNKIDGFNVIENIDFFLNAYNEVESHLQTDLNFLEGIQIYDQYRNYQINAGNILSSENYLYSSKSLTGQFILLPVKNTFLPFQQKLFEII